MVEPLRHGLRARASRRTADRIRRSAARRRRRRCRRPRRACRRPLRAPPRCAAPAAASSWSRRRPATAPDQRPTMRQQPAIGRRLVLNIDILPADGAFARSQIQPCSSRSTSCEITAMPASLSLRHGIAAKFSPPFALKISRVLDRDLLQRLQAVGGKSRRHHGEVLHAALRQRLHGLVGVGLQPFGAAEARLERQHQLGFVELHAARAAAAPSRRNASDRDRPRRRRISECRGTRPGSARARTARSSAPPRSRRPAPRYRPARRSTAAPRAAPADRACLISVSKGRVADRRGGRRGILRIERQQQDALAAGLCHRLDAAAPSMDCRSASPSRP